MLLITFSQCSSQLHQAMSQSSKTLFSISKTSKKLFFYFQQQRPTVQPRELHSLSYNILYFGKESEKKKRVCVTVCQSFSHVGLFVTLCLQPTRLLCPWNSPGKYMGVGRHSLLQGIFPTQGLSLDLLHGRQILYHLSNQGRIDAFELWCWRRLLGVHWTARRSNKSILKEISPGCSLEGLMLKLKLQQLAT